MATHENPKNYIECSSQNQNLRYHEIKDHLLNLTAFVGFEAVLLLRIDGLVIQSLWPDKTNEDLLPLAHWVRRVISKVSKELEEHTPHISYDRPPYIISFFKVGLAGILCGVFLEGANTTLLRIEQNRVAELLQDIFEKN